MLIFRLGNVHPAHRTARPQRLNDHALSTASISANRVLRFSSDNLLGFCCRQASHKTEREQYKACVLAQQYGMGAEGLASRIGQSPIRARELLRLHRETYPIFWRWSETATNYAMLTGRLHTVFGWHLHVSSKVNPRSLMNFPMQANGAEMLRLACCIATEGGVEVCAPVHDAVLIAAPLERLDHDIARMRDAMREASRVVLGDFELGTDVEIIRYPDRYADPRGIAMWQRVMDLIHKPQLGEGNAVA